ncbi:hypothetical protein BDV38DRAFT_68238 [Aspergillus pseudotamarii]|uniref:Uncharacterized protein n=1 Tax=Aspergillus pseudotamarii TaxID=132259 RepID=A0A5N6SYR4_ASPPS|nr:uncharacterized protein BDV38DRAFT_68238 [Aspergillus pseudotamarii]KAE8138563.1 hypothetical protein BDV38DRAFT_68238 [Aspergillus pseudotamarii]
MGFQPSPEEQFAGITHIDDKSYSLNSTELAVPSSDWNDIHLKALRVVLLECENERYSSSVLVQEVAELLGQVMEHATQVGGWRDQEAFVLSMHGTHLGLTTAHFSAAYLAYVNSSMMPQTERLWVRRSEAFDLKTRSGRARALQLSIGIFEYLRSGSAEIGLLQTIFQ